MSLGVGGFNLYSADWTEGRINWVKVPLLFFSWDFDSGYGYYGLWRMCYPEDSCGRYLLRS